MRRKTILTIVIGLLLLTACSETGQTSKSNDTDTFTPNTDVEISANVAPSMSTEAETETDFVVRDWTTDEFRFRTTSPTEVAIVSILVRDAECVIPAEVDGYTVTQCYGSIYNSTRSLIIPDSISGRMTGIGSLTFHDAHKDLVVTYKGETYTMVEGQLKGYYGVQEEFFYAIEGTIPPPTPSAEPDPNEGRHHYAVALEEFNVDAVGRTAAVLVDLDGDGEDEVVAIKRMGGNEIIVAFFDFDITPISRLQNKTIPEGYHTYSVTVSDTNRTPRVHFISESNNKSFYEYYEYREDSNFRYELFHGTLIKNPYLQDRTIQYSLYAEEEGVASDNFDDHTEQILAMTIE